MQINKWGNSLAVRLPATLIATLNLKAGDDIEIRVAADCAFEIARKPTHAEVLQSLRAFRGKIPASFKFDRDSANAR